ncbi:MAG: amidohydrolase family protein, partial [Rubrobacteridae bacterium]|nr:amidohydrolase family protein [Rubrobacteridae bacterium]
MLCENRHPGKRVGLDYFSTADFKKTIIHAEAIFDPNLGLVKNKALLVEEGRIVGINTPQQLAESEPYADVMMFDDGIVSPPFCDHHLHIFDNDPKRTLAIFDDLVDCGISTIYAAGNKHTSVNNLRPGTRNINDNLRPGLPTKPLSIKTAGFALYKKGFYGDFLGRSVDSVKDAKRKIDELLYLGVDFIKIIASGVFNPKKGDIENGGFDDGELAEIIGYAKTTGLPVHCHANGNERVMTCVEAGADVIVHGFFVDYDTIELMVERDTVLIPTLAALKRLAIPY